MDNDELIKDAAGCYGEKGEVRDALKKGMKQIGLGNIKTASTDRPKKKKSDEQTTMEFLILAETAEPAAVKAAEEEARNDGNQRMSMDGGELLKTMKNFKVLADTMEAAVPAIQKDRFKKFRERMDKALEAFNAGAAIALADIWLTDRSGEMGKHFRDFADEIIDGMGPSIGLKFPGRSYLDILPAHWLVEPSHLEAHSSMTWQNSGVAPGNLRALVQSFKRLWSGSGTDGTMEMV